MKLLPVDSLLEYLKYPFFLLEFVALVFYIALGRRQQRETFLHWTWLFFDLCKHVLEIINYFFLPLFAFIIVALGAPCRQAHQPPSWPLGGIDAEVEQGQTIWTAKQSRAADFQGKFPSRNLHSGGSGPLNCPSSSGTFSAMNLHHESESAFPLTVGSWRWTMYSPEWNPQCLM